MYHDQSFLPDAFFKEYGNTWVNVRNEAWGGKKSHTKMSTCKCNYRFTVQTQLVALSLIFAWLTRCLWVWSILPTETMLSLSGSKSLRDLGLFGSTVTLSCTCVLTAVTPVRYHLPFSVFFHNWGMTVAQTKLHNVFRGNVRVFMGVSVGTFSFLVQRYKTVITVFSGL